MCSWRIGMSLVTASEAAKSLLSSISGISRDGVLEWPTELGVRDEPDCLESRPPATVSACSSMLKDGIGGLRVPPEVGLDSVYALAWEGGIGGRSRVGAAEVDSAMICRCVAPVP